MVFSVISCRFAPVTHNLKIIFFKGKLPFRLLDLRTSIVTKIANNILKK